MLAIIAIGSTAWAGAALGAAANPIQLLDRVEAVSPTAVVDLSFKDPGQTPQFDYPPGATGGNFSACQLTGTDGLFCLDQFNGKPGRLVRNWNPVTAGSDRPLFSCEDSALVTLGFDTSKSTETCTGLTVGSDSAVFVAGKKKTTYSLIKVVRKTGTSCNIASPWTGGDLNQEPYLPGDASAPQYCWKQLSGWRDRPVLLDITATSVVLVNTSSVRVECSGVLGLEERKTLMFFPDPDINDPGLGCGVTPVVIATSKQWGLTGSQQLQSASILRTSEDDPATPAVEAATYAVATTSGGVVKAKDTSVAAASSFNVFNVPAERVTRTVPFVPRQCDFNPQNYGVRTSTKSKRVYLSDRNFCEVMALEPTVAGDLTQGLRNVTDSNNVDLTLSTWLCPDPGASTCTDPTRYYAPLEPTTAPGESIDLSLCGSGQSCTLTTRSSDPTAGTSFLSNVTLASSQTGLTLFQVQDIPDCRWIKQKLGTSALPNICLNGAIVEANGTALVGAASVAASTGTADTQYLDISKLLPREVTDQFRNNPLQPMYLQPKYRAQVAPNHPAPNASPPRYYFDAFFGIPETGVQFRSSFLLEVFVRDLSASGLELGCSIYPQGQWPVAVPLLLNWDLTVRISEKFLTVGGPSALSRTGILSNSGCGSTKNSGGGFSIYAYNLEYTRPDVMTDDLVFVNQVVAQFNELYKAQHNTAMVDIDGNGGVAPIPASVGVNLDNSLLNASDKLSKCLAASNYPKQSAALRNCQSFDSQMAGYLSTLDGIPACGTSQPCDVANRRGELRARVLTLMHLFDDRVLPSVPANGFNPPYGGTLPLPFPPP